MQSLVPVFDPLDGPYYEVNAERLRDSGFRAVTKERNARAALQRLLIVRSQPAVGRPVPISC